MSANLNNESGQPHRVNPNSLAALRAHKAPNWEPGKSGNPGGFPASVRYDVAYKKLSAMSDAEFKKYKPQNKAEKIAKSRILCAESTDNGKGVQQAANRAAEIVADRVDGKLTQNVNQTRVTVNFELTANVLVQLAAEMGIELEPARALALVERVAGMEGDE